MPLKAITNVARADGQPGQTKLLIVDDDPTTCHLLAIQLEMEGYACVTLSDAEHVLETVAEESPALILADFHMGAHGGLDLLHSIRNHQAYRDVPVVLMSALDHRRECEASGANGFVLKPFNLQDLVTTIRQVLAQPQRGGKEEPE